MKDNEIIKGYCKRKLCPPAQEIINRQNAEIERYKGVIKLLENDVKEAQAELKEFKGLYVNKIAEMGIKAFVERLKAEYADFDELHEEIRHDNLILAIDNLVKEMTEQSVNYGLSKTEGNG